MDTLSAIPLKKKTEVINKEVLKKYAELRDGIKNETLTINGGKPGKYGKDLMRFKFSSDDNLLLNKLLKLHNKA